MPKIGKRVLKIRGKDVEVQIFYSSEKGFYTKGLSEEIIRFGKKHMICGCETEAKLDAAIYKTLEEYHEFVKTSKKVIAYKLCMSTALCMNHVGNSSYSGYKQWIPNGLKDGLSRFGFNVDGNGFTIDWKVLIEENKDKVRYFEIRENGTIGIKTSLGKEYAVIDWTPEREEAFSEIDRSLEELVKRISLTFGDKDKTIFLLDNGRKLLTEGNETTKGAQR